MEQGENVFDASQVLSTVHAEVEQRFMGIDDLAHGWEHVSRVYTLALQLADWERGDRFIVGMAALLHDLGRTAPRSEPGHHADLSVTLATTLMQDYQVPQEQQEAVLHAVLAHSFSRGVEPRTLEARIVRDADRLDALGAIGILRWAVTGAVRCTPETRSYHPHDPFGQQHVLDDQRYILDHFFSKLLKLEETMLTETGRHLARHRTVFMRTYLQEFQRELELL
ncbi:MAG: HD domain-containing protein [Ktedonobacteraceae bacterium]